MSFICIVCRDLLTNQPEGIPPANLQMLVEIVTTKCGHLYHLHCLMEWFRRKSDISNPTWECPYCTKIVIAEDIQRIFPSEDEETEEIAAKFNEAKANHYEKEILQLQSQLEDHRIKLMDEQLQQENLKIDIALRMSEIEQMRLDHEMDLGLLECPPSTFKAQLDKVRKDRNKLVKTIATLEKKHAKQKGDMDKDTRRKVEDLQKSNSDLKLQNDSLKRKLQRLTVQHQQSQQPLRPVFPQAALPPPPLQTHMSNPISHSSASHSRRRSLNTPIVYCPPLHVATSGAQNSGGHLGALVPSHVPNSYHRPVVSGQSHFLNPPNPAQNPYQNLLQPAATSTSGGQNQPRISPNNGSSVGSLNTNVNQNSSSLANTAQHTVFPAHTPSGGASGGVFSSFPPFPHPTHPPHSASALHHMFTVGRNGNFQHGGYHAHFPSSSGSTSHMTSSGGEVQIAQVAHTQPETSSRALRMMMPMHLYMQGNHLPDAVVPFAGYSTHSQLFPAALSPRH